MGEGDNASWVLPLICLVVIMDKHIHKLTKTVAPSGKELCAGGADQVGDLHNRAWSNVVEDKG